MKSKEETFRFKQFTLRHSRSSMKVGIDGVLIGAWGEVAGTRGLDIGCGCGLIALMAAQRNSRAEIKAIDIHRDSVDEAAENFLKSPWFNRLTALRIDAEDFAEDCCNHNRYDFILSNPPFYKAGISSPITPREKARHEGLLSPVKLIAIGERLLKPGGTLSLIMPFCNIHEIVGQHSIQIERLCRIADRPETVPKRIMVRLRKVEKSPITNEILFIRNSSGEYTEAYRTLTSAFYLWNK